MPTIDCVARQLREDRRDGVPWFRRVVRRRLGHRYETQEEGSGEAGCQRGRPPQNGFHFNHYETRLIVQPNAAPPVLVTALPAIISSSALRRSFELTLSSFCASS